MAAYAQTLLASDMDGTVIPLESGERWGEDLVTFHDALEKAGSLSLAYVTGRDFRLALAGMRNHGLPAPAFLVCDVGTSVYRATEDGYEEDGEYARRMKEALGGVDGQGVRRALEGITGLSPQPPDRQTLFKFSFFLEPDTPHPELLGLVAEELKAVRGRIQVVYSIRPDDGTGLLDILPAGVAKDFAVRYLAEESGVGEEGVIYAGDSGNDLAAFLAGFRSIVVGNADEALKREVREKARANGLEERIYFAVAPYAGGVLEGCRHFGVL